MQLLNGETGNTTSPSVTLDGAQKVIAARGTFDGATVTTEWSPDGAVANFASLGSDATFTSAGQAGVVPLYGAVRLVVTGAGGSTDLNAWID